MRLPRKAFLALGTCVLLVACGSATPTPTPSATPTPDPTLTPTSTLTPVVTPSPTSTPTLTPLPDATDTPIPTLEPTPTGTEVLVDTPTPTESPTPTFTPAPSPTPTPGDDHPNAYPQGTPITVNTTASGVFETSQDVDVFVLQTAKLHYRYTATFIRTPGVDVDITVLDRDGNAVAFGGAADIAAWSGAGQQPYYIVLSSSGTAGSYQLKLTEAHPPTSAIFSNDDHPNAVPDGTLVDTPTPGNPTYLNGVLEKASDIDVFRFLSGSDGFYDAWVQTPSSVSIVVRDSDGNAPTDSFSGTNFTTWNTDPGKSWFIVVSGTSVVRYSVKLWVPD